MEKNILWGCIADNFEGAAEAASFFKKGGLETVIYRGIPKTGVNESFNAVVIDLETENLKSDKAVELSLSAIKYLKMIGTQKFYYKYSSNFYRALKNNVGQISKALMDELGVKKTILCPAFPEKGYTVKMGIAYINGEPISENKEYSLNKNESEIAELMADISPYPCINVDLEEMEEDNEEIWNRLNEFEKIMGAYYIVPDFVSEEDSYRIADIFGSLDFLTGGAGIIEALSERSGIKNNKFEGTDGKAIIISGSCSKSSLEQINKFIDNGGKAFKIDAIRLLYEKQTVGDLWNFMAENGDETVLIYSSDTEENVKYNQRHGAKEISESLKNAAAELVETAVMNDYNRIIILGSETADAITDKLGFDSYITGCSAANGIPVIIPEKNKKLRLVIKSGDSGDENFLQTAVKITKKI